MARYIDADAMLSRLPDDLPYKSSVKRVLMQAPTADVAPKSEVERLQAELEKQKLWERLLKAESHALIIQEAKSKIIEEYRHRVNRKMEKYTVFGREYIQRIMREVRKEMVGEKDV